MATRPAIGKGNVVIDGEKLGTETIEIDGERYTIRELTPDETDDIAEACTGPKPDYKWNGRLNTRMLLSKALVTPEIEIERVGKIGSVKYLLILQAFNRMNSLPAANPTPPAGQTEPESPVSGEPSPAS